MKNSLCSIKKGQGFFILKSLVDMQSFNSFAGEYQTLLNAVFCDYPPKSTQH